MSNNNLTRTGGIAAIASAILYVLSLGVAFSGSTSGLGTAFYMISSVLFLIVLVVVTIQLRTEAPLLALVALILLGAMTIWGMFLDPTQASPIFAPLTLAYGIGFILIGWVQRSSAQYPGGIGLLALITGIIAIIAGIALVAGASFDIFGLFNLALSVPYVIWLVWLGSHSLKARASLAAQA